MLKYTSRHSDGRGGTSKLLMVLSLRCGFGLVECVLEFSIKKGLLKATGLSVESLMISQCVESKAS